MTTHPTTTATELTALLDGNIHYTESAFPGPLALAPGRRLIILCCVDPRVDPARLLDLREGDAVVIRNVGGRVTPALMQSMAMLQAINRAGSDATASTEAWTVVVLQHTDCGITRLAHRVDLLATYFGIEVVEVPARHVTDPAAAVAGDVAQLTGRIAPQFTVVGLVHDLETGRVRTIDPAA